jgi:hypothetical protein
MVTHVICTWMVTCSTLLLTLLTEVANGFPHSLQATAGIVPQLEHFAASFHILSCSFLMYHPTI